MVVKRAFFDALPDCDIPVFISADEKTRATLSYDFSGKVSERANVIRLVANDRRWFERNWKLFAGDFDFPSKREVLVALKVDRLRLADLVSPWWDPGVLINPGVATSSTGLKEIGKQVEPGKIVFAITRDRLKHCELYLHPEDMEAVARCVYEAAHKTEWGVIRLGDGPDQSQAVSQKPQYGDAEGGVYSCHWKKTSAGYMLWVKGRPSVSAEDASFQSAAEKICEGICFETGDGEAVLDYSPLPPADAFLQGCQSPEIVSISGNDTVDAPGKVPGLFEHDYCPLCARAWGPRTDAALEVDALPKKSDGAVCMSVPFAGRIFSETFLSLLTEKEKNQFRMLQVKAKQPGRRNFYELIGFPVARFVGLKGLPGFESGSCERCGYVQQSHLFRNQIFSFVVAEDLPSPLPSVFFVGKQGRDLCMTAERWLSIRGKPGTRNLVAERIHVIPKSLALLPVVASGT